MSSQFRSESTLENARRVMTYLLREPVKDAVREALREEGIGRTDSPQSIEDSPDGSGTSKLLVIAAVLSIGGLAYLGRKRMAESGRLSRSETLGSQRSEHGTGRSTGSDIGNDTSSETVPGET